MFIQIFKDVSCGVPQGSILGPLLFIIYINDIQKCSNLFKFIIFADDTNLFVSDRNLDDLVVSVNEELTKLSMWFMANKLSLNVKKTNYMVFGRKGKQCNFNLSINGTNIDKVEFTKFLGVYIDENLTWKVHTSEMCSQIARSVGIMNKVKYVLSHKLLKMLYFSMIHPYLNYCIIIWGNASLVALKKLTILQKRAIRLITGSKYLDHTNILFKKCQILKLSDLYNFHVNQFVYLSLNSLLPSCCAYHIAPHKTSHNYEFRKEYSVISLPHKCCIREQYIGVIGPRLWNALPQNIQVSSSLFLFQKTFKKNILESY